MLLRSFAATALFLASTAAWGADAVVEQDPVPAPVATSGFTGGIDFSVYGGASASPHSDIDFVLADGTTGSIGPGWDGASFEMPPYYGIRATYWLESMPNLGVALDFTHAKVKADLDRAPGFQKLEFTDGINLLTANVHYRYEWTDRITPYVGVGVGASIPYVEVTNTATGTFTEELQLAGVAASALAGVDFAITDRISAFAEYKFSYATVDADLNNGGSLETDLIINQAAIGLTFKVF